MILGKMQVTFLRAMGRSSSLRGNQGNSANEEGGTRAIEGRTMTRGKASIRAQWML